MSLIEVKGIDKNFGSTRALVDINLSIDANRIYGLLGRNGAGKTTLLNLVTNRIFPTKGEIMVNGENVLENDRALGKIFYMTEANLYPAELRVQELFYWSKEFYPTFDMAYASSLAAKFGLDLKKRVKELSTGYGSIMKAIIALASNAEIVIFDEPVLGLDANHRDLFYRELIENYSLKPKTIIISTHLIEEVAEILEEVIIIKEGSIILQQSVEELLAGAYTVSGAALEVDRYLDGRQCASSQVIGKFKSATVIGTLMDNDKTQARQLDLELSKVELQQLFISLTNS